MLEYGGVCAGCERRAGNFSSCRHGRNAKLDERPVQYHAGVIAVAVGAELLEQRVADCGAARLGVLRIEYVQIRDARIWKGAGLREDRRRKREAV
jgi:hypothetical protein